MTQHKETEEKSLQRKGVEAALRAATINGKTMTVNELSEMLGIARDRVRHITKYLVEGRYIKTVGYANGRRGAQYVWEQTVVKRGGPGTVIANDQQQAWASGKQRLIDIQNNPMVAHGKAHPSAPPTCMERPDYDPVELRVNPGITADRLAYLDIPSRIGNVRYYRDGRTEMVV